LAHRDLRKNRVLVVAAGLFVGLACLWLRVAWLDVVQHAHYAERADLNQEQRVLLKPVRGQLLDRRGRPLARDLVTYSISAAPREMKDPRRTASDLARELDLNATSLVRRFAARPRFLWVARRVPPEVGQRIAEWGRRGVYVSLETRREYTLGAAAQEILGRTNLDNSGVEGLELQLDEELRGRPGWATLFRDGRGRTHALQRGMRRNPNDGRNVVLTLDADLQSIVETHLRRAVDTLRAQRAFALFLDPRTGEILASVNVPHLPPGKARNWNFTDQFEPGSTYKPVVTAAALEDGIAEPGDWFEASATGSALVAPKAMFHDVHKQAGCTLRDAVRWSSNIVMGRLAMKVGAERLYRYSTEFGFGSITGLAFPGEAGGLLRSPDRWSLRSCPTIAIGHELSVTPLQLALCYAAIANGGVLMQPMLVREIREGGGAPEQRYTPHASRRVLSEGTTRELREMLAAVVDSGTARAAQVPGLSIGGKTGTAQKYDASVRTYGRGMYLSSFAGFVPADEPRLVGVVVIDEPRGKHYYGGEVAAPVFREVLLDLRRLPHGLLEDGITQMAVRPPALAPVLVPDLRLLQVASVTPRLAEYGLRARFRGMGARVLAQDPPAGRAIERGTSITVWLSPPADSAARVLPDLTGMSVREALRRLGSLAVRARIEGSGIVSRQDPAAGVPLPLPGECRLWCRPMVRPKLPAAAQWARNGEP
jgi:cell division protein FtsI/penicillin-binding protein 2